MFKMVGSGAKAKSMSKAPSKQRPRKVGKGAVKARSKRK